MHCLVYPPVALDAAVIRERDARDLHAIGGKKVKGLMRACASE